MTRTIAILASAGLFVATAAQAQNAPPPGNINPGSMQSGQEQTGAPNQPRSTTSGAIKGTTGSGISSPDARQSETNADGTNANVKPSSPEADIPAGEPAGQRR